MLFKARAVAVASFFCWMQAAGAVLAGSFQVSPVRLELSAGRPTTALEVRNDGGEQVLVQLQLLAWSQDEGKDVYQRDDELVATPPIFTLQPGATQIVRIGLLGEVDAQKERCYRLFLQEVPARARPGFKGLEMALRIGVPVFIRPRMNAAPSLKWHVASQGAGTLRVELRNEGNAHVQLGAFTLTQPGAGQPFAVQQVASYLLAGQRLHWMISTAPVELGRPIQIDAETDAGSVQAEVAPES